MLVKASVVSGYAGYYRLYIDGLPAGTARYIDEGVIQEFRGNFEADGTKHTINLIPQGGWPDDIDPTPQVLPFFTGRLDRFKLSFAPVLEFFSYGETSQLSSWTLTGLNRFTNCMSDDTRPTWGKLLVTIANAAGVYTVELLMDDGTVIATGTRTGNGVITLEEVDDSGVSGSVTITYSGVITSGAYVVCRWPQSYKLHYRTSSFSGGDFPRTAEATVYDDGHSNVFEYRSGSLSTGTYYVVVHQVDDCGNESTGTTAVTVALVAPPAPPGTPSYSSGGYAATIIQFEASTDAAATYNFYDSGDTGILDMSTIATTRTAGSGVLTKTLAAISAGFTGIRRVVVRALLGGIEEGNSTVLELEYESGVFVAPRPNAPGVGKNIVISGRTLTVPFTITNIHAKATPVVVGIQIDDNPTFSGGLGGLTSTVSVALTPTYGTVLSNNTNPLTMGSDGWYWYRLWSQTSGVPGVRTYTEAYGPVYLETTVPSDATSVEVSPGT